MTLNTGKVNLVTQLEQLSVAHACTNSLYMRVRNRKNLAETLVSLVGLGWLPGVGE